MHTEVNAGAHRVLTLYGVFVNDYPVNAQRHRPGYAFVARIPSMSEPSRIVERAIGYFFFDSGRQINQEAASEAWAFLRAARPDLALCADACTLQVELHPAESFSHTREQIRSAARAYEHGYAHSDSNLPQSRRSWTDQVAWLGIRSDLILAVRIGVHLSPLLRSRFGVDLPDGEVMTHAGAEVAPAEPEMQM